MLRNNKEEEAETAGKAVHVVPPSIEYCQLPFVAVPSEVIAIPFKAPASGSVTVPRNEATV